MPDLLILEKVARARTLGAYYTPDITALAVARWAIRTGEETTLEPSAGGGALLRAAFARASEVSLRPRWRATAFDIDPHAIGLLKELNIEGLTVRHADFLNEDPAKFAKFDLILANPPFIRNHSMPVALRESLRERFNTKGSGGLWVPFLLHSLAFLKKGGRIASIVPKSALFTLHGDAVLKRLSSRFQSLGIFELPGRPDWSSYAEEAGAVILADGYLLGAEKSYDKGMLNEDGTLSKHADVAIEAYDQVFNLASPLDTFVTLSIGAVTGRNSIFLLSEAERKAADIDMVDLSPVVSRRRQLSGLTVTTEELNQLAQKGEKTWLLTPTQLSDSVKRYLSVITDEEKKSVVWFKKRTPWWKVQLATRYDAIFTYMNDLGPRVVKLAPGIVCTNTLHRVEFRPDTMDDAHIAVLLSPISTFGQLAAEKIGRAYSGGVLKFEILEARRIPIIMSAGFTNELAAKVDILLRRNDHESATSIVDEAFMPKIFGASWQKACSEMRIELLRLRESRRGTKGKLL